MIIFAVLFIGKILSDLISMSLVSYIAELSSSNPFRKHFIDNISDYYYLNLITHAPFQNMLLDFNETINYLNKSGNIPKKNKINFSENNNNNNKHLRKLESNSFCTDIFESFVRNKNRRLSYIFELNYNIIRGLSIPISIVSVLVPFSFFILNINNEKLYLIFTKKIKKEILDKFNESMNENAKLCCIMQYLLLIPWISKFVLSLLLFYYIEKGDIEKYNEFLDCKYVKKDFFKKFDDIEKLVLIFEIFVYLNLISEIINKILDFVEIYLVNAESEFNEREENKNESQSNKAISGDKSNEGINVKINNLE